MSRSIVPTFRRLGAWAMLLLLLVAQLAMPLGAAATAAPDLTTLPTLMLYYQGTDGTPLSLQVMPGLNGEAPVYWATLPAEAFTMGIPPTIEILLPPGSLYTYGPANYSPVDLVPAEDFNGFSTRIIVYQDGVEVGWYPLYLSSLPMPLPEPSVEPERPVEPEQPVEPEPPVQPEPVWVQVLYIDDQGEFYSTSAPCLYNQDNVISVDWDQVGQLRPGYTVDMESQYVTVDEQGNAYPNPVVFTFTAPVVQEVKGSVTVHYLGMDDQPLAEPRAQELRGEGPHNVVPEFIPDGYDLSPESPSSQKVTVDSQGNTDPWEISFHFKPKWEEPQEPEQPVEPEQPTEPEEPVEPETPDTQITPIGLYGMTNTNDVNFRTEPRVGSAKAASGVRKDVYVWVIGSLSANEEQWYQINYNGTECYVVQRFVTLLSQEDSDNHNYNQPSPVPGTETQPPTHIDVLVSYVDADDRAHVLYTESATCAVGGQTPVAANPAAVPGYTIVGDSSVMVEVSADGRATPTTVTFAMQKAAVKGSYTIRYVNTEQQDIATPQTVEQAPGTYEVEPIPADLPQGYVLQQGAQTRIPVTIDDQGNASPSTVNFVYEQLKGTVTVEYRDTLGATIADKQTLTLPQGETLVEPDPSLVPTGYTLQAGSPSQVLVRVDAQGNADPATIPFTYEANKATLTVYYRNTADRDIAPPQQIPLEQGSHSIEPQAGLVPTGFTLSKDSPAVVPVQVDAQGVAAPAEVIFRYDAPPATVTVQYVDTDNKAIAIPQQIPLTTGTHPIAPDASLVPTGYVPAEGSATWAEVTVDALGVATPATVTFRYQKSKVYIGYALTLDQTALRKDAQMKDETIFATLPKDTLLYINGQFNQDNILWSSARMELGEDRKSGVVPDSALKHITDAEAQAIIDQYNKDHAPPPTPKPTQEPAQLTGYYITVGSGVPLRNVTDEYAEAKAYLPIDTVVYVSGQLYHQGMGWHISTYNGQMGYIRLDQLRKLSDAEVKAYQDSLVKPTPTAAATPQPYDPYAKSSYAYATKSVNFRQTPNGTKIKTLNQYAFMLVLGTRQVNGVTWYNVNQSGTVGWVHGDYLHVLNLTELSSFLNSNEYLQGLKSSSSGSTGTSGSTGSTGSSGSSGGSTGTSSGGIISMEDWNVGTWKNPNTGGLNASYEPFNPYATPVPSIGPDPSASVVPTDTFVIGTMIPINYDDESKETQTDSSPWGVIGAAILLMGGAGGVYAYALNQNKKRKAAAKAAAANRRAGTAAPGAAAGTQARPGQGPAAQSPYARRAVAAPPLGGTQQGQPSQPNATRAPGGAQAPYGRPMQPPTATGTTGAAPSNQSVFGAPAAPTAPGGQNPYARPVGQAPVQPGSAPQATGTVQPGGEAARAGNPFAQPVGQGSGTDQARRVSRTQRYQSAEGKDQPDA